MRLKNRHIQGTIILIVMVAFTWYSYFIGAKTISLVCGLPAILYSILLIVSKKFFKLADRFRFSYADGDEEDQGRK